MRLEPGTLESIICQLCTSGSWYLPTFDNYLSSVRLVGETFGEKHFSSHATDLDCGLGFDWVISNILILGFIPLQCSFGSVYTHGLLPQSQLCCRWKSVPVHSCPLYLKTSNLPSTLTYFLVPADEKQTPQHTTTVRLQCGDGDLRLMNNVGGGVCKIYCMPKPKNSVVVSCLLANTKFHRAFFLPL